jgi:hypothetical protein
MSLWNPLIRQLDLSVRSEGRRESVKEIED